MKVIMIGFVVFIFVIVPLYMLDTLVMPQLRSLAESYAGAEALAQNINNEAASGQ